MRPVVLVGLMGSGKSTVGALVAAAHGTAFVDVDVVITARTGQDRPGALGGGRRSRLPVPRVRRRARVLATTPRGAGRPGGRVLDPVVRAALADCVVVWLRTSPSTLAGRVRPGDHRPLLGDRPAETFAAMAEMRSELYRQVATAISIRTTSPRKPLRTSCSDCSAATRRTPEQRNGRHDAATTGHHRRETKRLDGIWSFTADACRGGPRRGLVAGRRCPMPDACPFRAASTTSWSIPTLHDHVGDVWYQRPVFVPRGWAGQRVVLRFDAATHRAAVWIGDTLVAEHEGGYTPFEADVTALVTPGEECRLTVVVNNELDVAVDPAGRRGSACRRNPATAPVPRLLQLRRPAPQRLDVHDPHALTSTTSPW